MPASLVILSTHQVWAPPETNRRGTSLLSALSPPSPSPYTSRLLPLSLSLHLSLQFGGIYSLGGLLGFKCADFSIRCENKLLWSGRSLTCQDCLLLHYPFLFSTPSYFLSRPLYSLPQRHFPFIPELLGGSRLCQPLLLLLYYDFWVLEHRLYNDGPAWWKII